MAVIIPNMDMPKNCYDCELHNYHECNLTNESIEEDYCWNGDSREKHCPLKSADEMTTYYPPCEDCHKKMDEIRRAYDKVISLEKENEDEQSN